MLIGLLAAVLFSVFELTEDCRHVTVDLVVGRDLLQIDGDYSGASSLKFKFVRIISARPYFSYAILVRTF